MSSKYGLRNIALTPSSSVVTFWVSSSHSFRVKEANTSLSFVSLFAQTVSSSTVLSISRCSLRVVARSYSVISR